MPSPRRKNLGRHERYNEDHILALQTGHDYFWAFKREGISARVRRVEGSDDHEHNAKREAWELLGDEILAAWVEDKPLTRPWAWWKFTAPEPRQRIDGGVHPHDDPRRPVGFPKQLEWGIPRNVALVPGDTKAKYETEREYLERLDLLTDHEKTLTPQPKGN